MGSGLHNGPLWFYHPTRWALVDDQEDFALGLAALAPVGKQCSVFCDAQRASTELNGSGEEYALTLSTLLDGSGDSFRDPGFGVDLEPIVSLSRRKSLKSAYSVVVADYLMPDIDGLEFLDSIELPHTKKLLLTGAADQELAVSAFNSGLIDRFIMKGEENALELFLEYSLELEMQFHRSVQARFSLFNSPSCPVSVAKAIDVHMRTLVMTGELSEYYREGERFSYLCFKQDASYFRVAFLPREDFEGCAQKMAEFGFSRRQVESVREASCFAFLEELGGLSIDEVDSALTFDVSPLKCLQEWYVVRAEDPALDASSFF